MDLKIRLIKMDNCPFCKQMEEGLISENISFEVIDANNNESFMLRLSNVVNKPHLDLPIVIINKKLLLPNDSFKSIPEGLKIIKQIINNPDIIN